MYFLLIAALIYGFLIPKNLSDVSRPIEKEPVKIEEKIKDVQPHKVFPMKLQAICTCESGWKHYDENGKVLRGRINPDDIGICQINQNYWGDDAERLGLDIFTEEGNKKMAEWIYEKYGDNPWNWSRACWDKAK